MASCLFLPVAIALVLSKVMTPIFVSFYLLLVLPYLAVLAAVGIVTLAGLGGKGQKLVETTIPAGIVALVLTLALSAMGVKSYFETFQKENLRGVAQFLVAECPAALYLYDVPFMEGTITYYNPRLKSQVDMWHKLSENPSPEELAVFLGGYNQACLVIGLMHIGTPEDKAQLKIIQTALQMRYPKETEVKFYWVNVEVYEK